MDWSSPFFFFAIRCIGQAVAIFFAPKYQDKNYPKLEKLAVDCVEDGINKKERVTNLRCTCV